MMRLLSFVAVASFLVFASPVLMHGQCAGGTVTLMYPCQGSGSCTATEVTDLETPMGNQLLKEVSATKYCGLDCWAFYTAARGQCFAAALNKQSIRENLEQLSRESSIPILVASCTGGLVEFYPNEPIELRPPQSLDVDTQILKESISFKKQKHSGE